MSNIIFNILVEFTLPFLIVYLLVYLSLHRIKVYTKKQKKIIALILSLMFVGLDYYFMPSFISFIEGIVLFIFVVFLLSWILEMFGARFNPNTITGRFIVLIIITIALYAMLSPAFNQQMTVIIVISFFLISFILLLIEIFSKNNYKNK